MALGTAIMLVAVACAPAGVLDSTTTTTTTTIAPESTTIAPPMDSGGNLLPPERSDTAAVAEAALAPVNGFDFMDEPPQYAEDLVVAMETWLPPDLVAGTADAVYENDQGTPVSVVSVIPALSWRGDPGFVESLIVVLTGSQPDSPGDGIFTAKAPGGAVMQLWSTGDGFVVASSLDEDAAIAYLETMSASGAPNDVWPSGSCLYIADDEALPYAPFPEDVVVPCAGAHNAEVLLGIKIGTDLTNYDEDANTYDRDYKCDQVYEETFGSQRTHTPSLVTYMPDADEWKRGDRYLACVVKIDRNDGSDLIAGPMAALDDLTWEPDVGDCLVNNLPADTVDCRVAHTYQYLGDVVVDADAWPKPGDRAFVDACAPLVDELATGPAELDVFPVGLGAYAFEQGDRTVRCMAFASVDGFLVDVVGSFNGEWRPVGEGGVAV